MLTVAQNNLNAARQKKNEQKELDNLLRVFEWCVACAPHHYPRLSAHACAMMWPGWTRRATRSSTRTSCCS